MNLGVFSKSLLIMKSLAVMCFVFVVMAAVGPATGDLQGSDRLAQPQEGSDSKVCPLPPDIEDGFSREKLVIDNAFYCVVATNGSDIRRDILTQSTPDDLRTFFRNYCAMAPVANRCVANVTSIAELCLARPRYNVFKVTRDLILNVHDVGCVQDGERLANIYLEVKESFNQTQRDALSECSRIAENMVVNRITTDSRLIGLQRYRVIKSFKECVVEFGRGESAVVNKVEEFITEVLNGITCFDQLLNTVLCYTIDNS